MSEEHSHDAPAQIRYTIYLDERTPWGAWAAPLEFIGTGSSKQADELLIHSAHGFTSINYGRVRYFTAEQL